jgi:diadenosine tetraphosphatase ApaH/serine/threonine PP2A family protein phosphatase
MKIALISDIHSNSEALAAVMAEIASLHVDEIYCLGDLVGYGPEPNECVTQIQETASLVLAGNHDFAAVGLTPTDYFNRYARDAIDWTAHNMTPENNEFLAGLDITFQTENALFVHATPEDPGEWDYIFSQHDAERNFKAFSEQVCFIGHSHIPNIFIHSDSGSIESGTDTTIEFIASKRYIVNIGSVGQPRDLDPRASFGIFDSDARTFVLKRADYAVAITQDKIREAGLPRFLADRLSLGQ